MSSSTDEALLQFLDDERLVLESAKAETFVQSHESFLRRLAAMSPDCFSMLREKPEQEYAPFFRACHLRYLRETEMTVQHRVCLDEVMPLQELLHQVFGEDFHLWQDSLAWELSRVACSRLAMVGCGPLPATLLWVSERYPELDSVGLDSNAEALAAAESLARHLGRRSLRFACIDGCNYDYADTDLVYIANQVSPKREVLNRIRDTATRPLTVIMRDPIGNGWLLAEQMFNSLPSGYTPTRTAGESPVFLSRDLILRLDAAITSGAR